jgi:hypothetical protein
MTYGNFGEESQKAIDALMKGESVVSDAEAQLGDATPEESSVVEEPSFSMDADYGEPETESEVGFENQEEIAPDSVDDSKIADSESNIEDIEYIKADGKKVKIDYTDRERIKKVHQMAAGARKWQSERDSAIKELTELKEKHSEVQSILDKCDAFVKDGDDEGLFRLITGGKELEDLVQARIEEREELSVKSPAEIDAWKNKKEHDKRMKELERREAAYEARIAEADKKLDESDKLRQQSMVNSVFNEHRFAGKFGDAKREYRADKMLWREVVDKLGGMESVTQEVINTTIREAAEDIRELINIQANKKADKQIKKQKTEAKKEVQKAVFEDENSKKRKLQQQVKEKNYASAITDILSGDLSFFK